MINKPRTATAQTIAVYLGIVLLSVVMLIWVMQLWNADLSLPFRESGGDTYFNAMLVKNLGENGNLYQNAFLGAPDHMDLHDFPQPYFLDLFFVRLLYLFSHNFIFTLNLYFLLTFPLTAVISLFVFRCFKVSWVLAIFGSLLYTFLPYHFMRGELHFFLSSYYLIPLIILVSLWIATGKSLFPFGHQGSRRAFVTDEGLISLFSCALIALNNPYYAFFGGFFLVIAAAVGCIRHSPTSAIRSVGILLGTLLLTFAISLAPNTIYAREHGKNPRVAQRDAADSELYGLRIAQLVLPVTGHRVRRVADRKDDYNRGRPMINENDEASLGVIGSCGFVGLVGWLVLGKREENSPPLLHPLGVLNVSAVLFGTIGGFSSLFAFEVSPTIRSYNRISIYIGFLALFAVVLFLQRMRAAWATRSAAQTGRDGLLFCLLVLSLSILGVLDQTTPDFAPHYREIKAAYENDAHFVRNIEDSLPQGAMVFQLPYMPFPEAGGINGMRDYDHLRGYLHSKTLRWSYGAMKGRDGDVWEKNVAAQPIDQMVETLMSAGFGGIYIDRFAYLDHGAKLESDLSTALRTTPVVSENRRLSFFKFPEMNAKLP